MGEYMGKTKSKNNSIFSFLSLKNIKYTNKLLLFFSVVLFVFGLIMIFSSSSVSAFVRYHKTPYYFVLKEMVFHFLGIIVFIVISIGIICPILFWIMKFTSAFPSDW